MKCLFGQIPNEIWFENPISSERHNLVIWGTSKQTSTCNLQDMKATCKRQEPSSDPTSLHMNLGS